LAIGIVGSAALVIGVWLYALYGGSTTSAPRPSAGTKSERSEVARPPSKHQLKENAPTMPPHGPKWWPSNEYKREDRRWWAWCDDLVKEEHADFAWVPEFLDVFDACYEAYNFGDITDVGEVREYDRQQWQWCRIWCLPARQYHWRWIPACGNCGFARCPTTCPSYWIIRTAQRADGHRVTPWPITSTHAAPSHLQVVSNHLLAMRSIVADQPNIVGPIA
jgi:hypothetical protein